MRLAVARACRTCLITATVLASTVVSSPAQIAVPDVSAGAKSSVPSLSTFQAPPSSLRSGTIERPAPTIAPTTPDPRCTRLTLDQRRLTPGCQ